MVCAMEGQGGALGTDAMHGCFEVLIACLTGSHSACVCVKKSKHVHPSLEKPKLAERFH